MHAGSRKTADPASTRRQSVYLCGRSSSIQNRGIQLKRFICAIVLATVSSADPLTSQTNQSQTSQPVAPTPETTLHITSRAVLVDVLVTDHDGRPVKGLKQNAFTINEQGKPQTISFFEEHTGAQPGPPKEMPRLPPNVFSNFSPFPEPSAVNLLLLDSPQHPHRKPAGGSQAGHQVPQVGQAPAHAWQSSPWG